jgi:hypothetical protein
MDEAIGIGVGAGNAEATVLPVGPYAAGEVGGALTVDSAGGTVVDALAGAPPEPEVAKL